MISSLMISILFICGLHSYGCLLLALFRIYLCLLPIKRAPGFLTECVYNFGVAMITFRSIYKSVIIIYNTTGDSIIMAYTILSIIGLVVGLVLYIIDLLLNKNKIPAIDFSFNLREVKL